MVLPVIKMYGDDPNICPYWNFSFTKKICRTSDGTLHVVSTYGPPGYPGTGHCYDRWSYSRDNGSTWTHVTLRDIFPGNLSSVSVVCDLNDNIHFAIGYGKLYWNKATVNKTNPLLWTWSLGALTQIGTYIDISYPDIIVDNNSYIHIVYFRDVTPSVWARSTNGGTTWTEENLYLSFPFPFPPSTMWFLMAASIDKDSLNNLYVGFGTASPAVPRKNFAMKITYTGGTTWTKGSPVAVSSVNSNYCQLRVLPDDRICMIYDLGGNHVVFRKSTNVRDITVWGSEIYIANGTRSGLYEYSLSYQDASNLFVVYPTSAVHANSDLVMKKSTDGGSTWSAPEYLTDNNLGNRVPSTLKVMLTDTYPKIVFRDGVFVANPQAIAGNLWFAPADAPVVSSLDELYKTHFFGFQSSGDVPILYLSKDLIITKEGNLYLRLGNGNLIQLS